MSEMISVIISLEQGFEAKMRDVMFYNYCDLRGLSSVLGSMILLIIKCVLCQENLCINNTA